MAPWNLHIHCSHCLEFFSLVFPDPFSSLLPTLPSQTKLYTSVLGMVEVYFRYEGENRQRYLEGSRLNWTTRGVVMGRKREEQQANRLGASRKTKKPETLR